MNRQQQVIVLIGAVQVGISVALGTQAVQPPLLVLPPITALLLLVVNAMLVYVQTQLKSWSQSGD